MAKPPRIPTLRETDLAIKDGPIDGAALRDAFKRYFALVNASNDATNKSLSKGLTIADNLHCDTLTVSATHATPFTVRLQTIKAAKSCLVTGGDTLLPFPLAAVQMLQPAQTGGGINACSVTVYFQLGSGTANVRLWLFEDGQQATATLAWPGDTAWTAITPGAGLANFGAPYLSLASFKDASSRVYLRGLLTSGAGIGIGATMFTTASGYRPSATVRMNCQDSSAAKTIYPVDIDATGAAKSVFALPAGGNVSFDGTSFDTR